jgi:hypothetical protein
VAAAYSFVPAGKQGRPFLNFHGRVENGVAFPAAFQFISAFPKTCRYTGKTGCAQGGGLADHGADYRAAGNIRLKLHQEIVAACAAVRFQFRYDKT